MDCEKLDGFMLNQAHLGLDSGYLFGKSGEGFMRMNIACPMAILEKALGQLESALGKL